MFGGKSFLSFSKRQGIEPLEKPMQLHSMDEALRNGLWNVFHSQFVEDQDSQSIVSTFKFLWRYFFKWPVDTMPRAEGAYAKIREQYFAMTYNRTYDFLMFLAVMGDETRRDRFKRYVNWVLEDEFSAYRFVDDYIAPITDDEEIRSIETAISSGVNSVKSHLKTALRYISDKNDRNYRNSIKESISALEALCAIITGKPSNSLGESLKEMEKKSIIELHPSLKSGYEKIYGYTSDADGIRHGMSDEPNVKYEDAQYMLVSCSAFVNYLIAKANAAGIKLS